jgi:hypothetical protein
MCTYKQNMSSCDAAGGAGRCRGSPQNMRFEIHIEAGDLLPRPTRDDDAKKVSVVFASYDENMNQPSPPRNRL